MNARTVGLSVWLLVCCACFACGDEDEVTFDATAGADARPLVDATAALDAGPCNDLVQTATEIAQMEIAADPPVAVGGPVPDGIYHLVEEVLYSGLPGPTGRFVTNTVSCTALACESTFRDSETNVQLVHETFTLTIDGADLSIAYTCPSELVRTATFDSDGSRFTVYQQFGLRTRGRVFELQSP